MCSYFIKVDIADAMISQGKGFCNCVKSQIDLADFNFLRFNFGNIQSFVRVGSG